MTKDSSAPGANSRPHELIPTLRDLVSRAQELAQGPLEGRQLELAESLRQEAQELLRMAVRLSVHHEQLREVADTDGLTGLPNFRAFQHRLDDEDRRARRYRQSLSVVMIDLDHFKALNDSQGHEAGNRALIKLAEVIRNGLRSNDFAARYGGDEFVILLTHTGAHQAEHFAERIRAGVHALGTTDGIDLRVSVGVASVELAQGNAPLADELLRKADSALYTAKRSGRDRISLAPPAA